MQIFRVLVISIVCLGVLSTRAFGQSFVFDDFSTSSGWTDVPNSPMPQGCSFTVTEGNAVITNGSTATVFVLPRKEKIFNFSLQNNSWVHIRVKTDEVRLGADMYAELDQYETSRGWQNLAQWIMNGEGHWTQQDICAIKGVDDEFNLGSAPIRGYLADGGGYDDSDLRLGWPTSFTAAHYDSWNILSVKLESQKLRFYINGREIPYYDLNAQRTVDNTLDQVVAGATHVRLRVAVLSDGNLYSNPQSTPGGRGCYSETSPSAPGVARRPPVNARAKITWMNQYDCMLANASDPQGAYKANIWTSCIYTGGASLTTAVLSQAIPLPDANHPQWQYEVPGLRTTLQSNLNYINSTWSWEPSLRKRYFWYKLTTTGYTALTIYHRYLLANPVRMSSQWGYLSSTEKNQIPGEPTSYQSLASVAASSVVRWDYFFANTTPASSDAKNTAISLIQAGRMGTSDAIFLQLLTWQEAQFNCPYISTAERNEVRAHPLGSASFCA